MAKSTFQHPPVKILVGDASASTITGSGTESAPWVISAGGQIISFTTADIEYMSEEICTSDGDKQEIVITFDAIEETCECVRDASIRVIRKHGRNWKISNTYQQTRFYKASAAKGVTATIGGLVAKLEDIINADEFSPVTAASSGAVLTLTSKENGIATIAVATESSATIVSTPGVEPVLTADDILIQFPIKPHTFGQRPLTGLCYDCMCFYTLKLRKNNGYDPIEGGGESTLNEYHFYVGCEDPTADTVEGDADWAEDWTTIYTAKYD
jgi:hypothetical protein